MGTFGRRGAFALVLSLGLSWIAAGCGGGGGGGGGADTGSSSGSGRDTGRSGPRVCTPGAVSSACLCEGHEVSDGYCCWNRRSSDPCDAQSSALVADHYAADAFDQLTPEALAAARDALRIWYGHTSHGSQITTGMCWLADRLGADVAFDAGGGADTLHYDENDGVDLGHEGDLSWAEMTRDEVLVGGHPYNVVVWSWCGGVSDNTSGGIDAYLQAMAQLETDFPDVTFVYMTGHAPSPSVDGCEDEACRTNTRERNEQIRQYVASHGKVLFDFADIDRHEPGGVLHEDAEDSCLWCDHFCSANGDDPDCAADCSAGCSGDCAHSHCLNCLRKGRAFWWLLVQLAERDGS